MVDFAQLLFALLNLLSTWRVFVCLLASSALAAIVCVWLQPGTLRLATVVVGLVFGVCVGAIWQTQHERRVRQHRNSRA